MNAIKLARIRAGLDQYELADRAGLTQATISRLEQGKGTPHGKTLGKLAAALGVDVLDLLEGSPGELEAVV